MAKKDQSVEHQPKGDVEVIDYAADAGAGMEDMGMDDIVVPLLMLLQKGSPQVSDLKPEYIDGAKAGMFFNKATNDVYNGPIFIIPCFYTKVYMEWKPKREGLAGIHSISSNILQNCTPNDRGGYDTPNGNALSLTAQYFSLLLGSKEDMLDEPYPVVLSMYSTGLKKSRAWNSAIKNLREKDGNGIKFTPPMYSQVYAIKSEGVIDGENDWYTWDINHDGVVSNAAIYRLAKSIYQQATKGRMKVDMDSGGEDVPF